MLIKITLVVTSVSSLSTSAVYVPRIRIHGCFKHQSKYHFKVNIILRKKTNKKQPSRGKSLKAAFICQNKKRRGGTTNDPIGNTSLVQAAGMLQIYWELPWDSSAASTALLQTHDWEHWSVTQMFPQACFAYSFSSMHHEEKWEWILKQEFQRLLLTVQTEQVLPKESPALACSWNVLFCPKHQRS